MRHDDDAWLLDMHQAAMKARAFVSKACQSRNSLRTSAHSMQCCDALKSSARRDETFPRSANSSLAIFPGPAFGGYATESRTSISTSILISYGASCPTSWRI